MRHGKKGLKWRFAEYAEYDGLGLAALVAKGQVTPLELAEEAIARIEKHNPRLNAVIYKMYDQARDTAKQARRGARGGRSAACPSCSRTSSATTPACRRSYGARFLSGMPAAQDDTLVVRFKAAGLVPLGKTNVPEFGLLPTHRVGAVRRLPQPLEPRPLHRRLERRLGGGGGGRHRADRARQRRRRLDPHPRVLLRAGRPQADARPQSARARCSAT